MALKISVSKPRMVLDVPSWFPNVVQLKNGEVFTHISWGRDVGPTQEEYDEFYGMNEPTDAKFWMDWDKACYEKTDGNYTHIFNAQWAYSNDGCKTFTPTGLPYIVNYIEKENGDVTGLQWYSYHDKDGNPIVRSWTSHDQCRTWDAPYDIPMVCPPIASPVIAPWRSTIHLEGDTYLTLIYGCLVGDTCSRVMVFRTTDNFKTLHYYSTIAIGSDDMELPRLNETDFIRVPDGRLLAVMRNESFCSMYQSFSSDNGATWTPAKTFVDAGVDPALCVLDNDVVVCSYGRPGVKVAFSENNGENWKNITTLLMGHTEVDGTTGAQEPWYQRSCCYTAIAKTAPNVATVFYSAPSDWNDDPAKTPWKQEDRPDFRMYAVDVTVERA